jgi:putative iron-regulated protein
MVRYRFSRRLLAAGVIVALATGAAACGDDDDEDASAGADDTGAESGGEELTLADDDAEAVATTYADLVHAGYADATTAAEELQAAIGTFLEAPTEESLTATREAWLTARQPYTPTEAFRFYDGPIDNPEDGPEGQINAWPLDEAYLDYVDGDPAAGIVNDTAGAPEITTDVLVAANEQGGETNISTGWHAIEFLLWGQDMSDDSAGTRPVTDFTTSPTAERRATTLRVLSELLVADLASVRDEWAPDGGAYREEFLSDPGRAVSDMLRGMGALSSGELAGERLAVAYETKDQEDEHSCFSDNTTADVVGNAVGIRNVYLADHPEVDGTSLSDVVAEADADLDEQLRTLLDENVERAEALEAPFDQLILGEDDAPGRQALLELIEGLQEQGDVIAELAGAYGYQISLEI